MKKKGYDIDECSYQEMTKEVGGQSQPQPYWKEQLQNEYEKMRKSNFNQSGAEKK